MKANADQRIEQSRRAVEIETNRAEAEVQTLRWMAQQLTELKHSGEEALPAYIRNIRLELLLKAKRVISERKTDPMAGNPESLGDSADPWRTASRSKPATFVRS